MPTTKKVRFISKPEVLGRTSVTYPTIWAWMRENKFPRSRDVGGRSCWIESEIEEWILSRPVCQLKAPDPKPKAPFRKPPVRKPSRHRYPERVPAQG